MDQRGGWPWMLIVWTKVLVGHGYLDQRCGRPCSIDQGSGRPCVSVAWLKEVHVPYFFGYKTGFFFFQNNPKDLDPSCKMDLDVWDC